MAQFLATSSSRPAAERFVTRAADTLDADGDGEANLTVLWTIELDRQQRCLYVNRLTEGRMWRKKWSSCSCSPRSPFFLGRQGAVWSDTPTDAATPHQITIRAAVERGRSTRTCRLPLAMEPAYFRF